MRALRAEGEILVRCCILRWRRGWAEDPQIRALADAHRHDALFCWMGSGADVHGFRFGFRALRCGSTQMIVRHGDEEQLIQLWTEEG